MGLPIIDLFVELLRIPLSTVFYLLQVRGSSLKLLASPVTASGFFLNTWRIDLFIELLRNELSTVFKQYDEVP